MPSGTIRVEATQRIPIDRLADGVLSISTSSPERLGDDVPETRRAMRDALLPFAADGVIEEPVEASGRVRKGRVRAPESEACWPMESGGRGSMGLRRIP